MSLKRNTIANYLGHSYAVLLGIVIMPLYLTYLGPEPFGLVGFFILVQTSFHLLDMGLSPTLGRQIAYARGKNQGFKDFIKLLRSFEVIFFFLALLTSCSFFLAKNWISSEWIDAHSLSSDTIAYCITLMGLMVGLRWFSSLYRSGINGLEDQVVLNIANTLIMSVKYIGALLLLHFITTDISHFFNYQLIVGIFEAALLVVVFYARLPVKTLHAPFRIHWPSLKSVAPFAMGIGYTAGVWIIITQTDKLVLSTVLPLNEFGYFSLVALIAGVVIVLTGPITQAILPRMTVMLSQGRKDQMICLYRDASQFVALIATSVAIMIGLNAELLIYVWTGDMTAAQWSGEPLLWFSLGNGVLALSAFQYYLQNAFGRLRLHVIGSTISAAVQIPIIYFAAIHYGAIGTGMAWFSFRLIWFLFWTPIIHHVFLPGFHLNWLLKDLFPVVLTVAVVAYLIADNSLLSYSSERFYIAGALVATGIMLLLVSSISLNIIRQRITNFIRTHHVS